MQILLKKAIQHFLLLLLLSSQQSFAEFSEQPVLSANTPKGISIDIFSEIAPLDINRIHSWQLRLTDIQGSPVSNAQIELVGGMPEHDHGLPTQPQITAETEVGSYLLEGVRFHMPGNWQLDIKLTYKLTYEPDTAGLTTETITIEFQL
jgi:hypothetical protein|tara:strand:- start:56 stop:502 length:447 start_codon:yes stop_codon:yes gene_type:complete